MSIVVIGVNHRTGSLSLLERLAIDADAQGKALAGLIARQNIREAVVLCTCNRTEVYAVAERFHGAYADIRDFLCELGGARADELTRTSTATTTTPPSATSSRSPPASTRRCSARARSSARCAPPGSWPEHEGSAQGHAQPAVPPRRRDRQAGPHRDRHRPRHRVGQPRRGRDGHRAPRLPRPAGGCSWSAPATWARAWPPRCVDAGATDIGVANRTRRAGRGTRRARRRPRSCRSPTARRRSPRPTCCSRAPAPASTAHRRRAGVDGAARRIGAPLLDRRHRRAARRRRRRRRPRRRHAARHRRPPRCAGRALRCAPSEAAASHASSPKRSSGSLSRRPPARPHRSSPSCTSGPRRSARPSSTASLPASATLDDGAARRGRGAHQGHRRQAAARAVGAPEGRRRHAAGRAQRRGLRDLFDLG